MLSLLDHRHECFVEKPNKCAVERPKADYFIRFTANRKPLLSRPGVLAHNFTPIRILAEKIEG